MVPHKIAQQLAHIEKRLHQLERLVDSHISAWKVHSAAQAANQNKITEAQKACYPAPASVHAQPQQQPTTPPQPQEEPKPFFSLALETPSQEEECFDTSQFTEQELNQVCSSRKKPKKEKE